MFPIVTVMPYLRAVWGTSPVLCTSAFALLLLGGIFEGIGLLMLIPVLHYLGVGDQPLDTSNGDGGLMDRLISLIDGLGLLANASTLFLLLFFVLILRSMISYAEAHLGGVLEAKFLHEFRTSVYSKLTSANWLYLSRLGNSKMYHATTVQAEHIAEGTGSVVHLAAAGFSLVIGLVLAFLLSVQLTLIVLGAGVFIFAAMAYFNRRTALIAAAENQKTGRLFQLLETHFSGLKTMKVLSATPKLAASFFNESKLQSQIVRQGELNQAQANLFFQVSSAAILIGVVFLSTRYFPAEGSKTILFVIIFARLAPKSNAALTYLRDLVAVSVEFDKSQQLTEEAELFQEAQGARDNESDYQTLLRFENVGFSYGAKEKDHLINDVNLEIKQGSSLGIEGPSGEGKSTLIDLLSGLIAPTSGKVTVDGTELNDDSRQEWLRYVTYVPQDAYLFDGTIEDNLKIANESASEAEIWRALELTNIHDFVRGLNGGLQAKVGSQGVMVSRGQRQRLCLARALLQIPNFLILDEALNALSLSDEKHIMKNVRSFAKLKTLVVVSHRPSSLEGLDQVVSVKGGVVRKAERAAAS